jgi:hypothetical protein
MPLNGSETSSPPDTSLPAMSTSDQFSMFPPSTCAATPSAISSPASAAGASPCALPDGPTTAPSGPAPARVSRFRARDSGAAMPTSDTSGPLFTASSPSADLQWSLANRLRARMAGNGSPLFELIWSDWDMPAGPPICRLRASARRTSGSDCGSWATPISGSNRKSDRAMRPFREGGESSPPGLEQQAEMAMASWPTPAANRFEADPEVTEKRRQFYKAKHMNGNGFGLTTAQAAQLASWPTPTKGNADGSQMAKDASATERRPDGSKAMVSLNQVATLASWPTPMATDGSTGSRTIEGVQNRLDHGNRQVELSSMAVTTLGPTSSGCPAATAKRGQLNPAFSLWLMGYPREWGSCAPQATRSSRKSRRSS